jgi:phage-related holin
MDFKTIFQMFLYSVKAFFFGLAAALFAHLLPLKQFVAVTLMMVVFDLISGIQAAKKRGEIIHSKGLRRSVLKFAMYCMAILGGDAIARVYFPTFPMVYAISCYICVTEFYSVLENVGTVTGTNVLSVVREQLEKVIKKPSNNG